MRHVLEQPSPEPAMPSSHSSPRSITPLPQIGTWMHGMPGCVQRQPGSVRHAALQPSPAAMPPSSQFSPGSTRESPQEPLVGLHGWPGVGQ
jgi:hypothetical protein